MVTENFQLIEFALLNGAVVRNNKGETIKIPTRNDYLDRKKYDDEIKCYVTGVHYYWSTAEIQEGLTFDGMTYEEWKEKPIGLKS